MNPLVSRPVAILLIVAAFAACAKKKEVVSLETEANPPAVVQPGGRGEPVAEPAVAAAAVPTAAELAADPAVAGVPSGLLASDLAYEAWFKKYHLDLNDPKMLDADNDGDGATNREEFMADTDPTDPNSRPGIHKGLRLKEYKEVKVPLILESVTGHTAKIRRLEEGEPKSDLVEVGQNINGMKVEKIAIQHETDKSGQPLDLSRVELSDPATKAKVVLVKDMPAKSASSYAVLTADDGTTIKVSQGQVFQWPAQNGTSYRVIDLRAEQGVVEEVETRRMLTIPMK